MKDYKVILTETKTFEATCTAPSADIALDMVRTLKTQTPIVDDVLNDTEPVLAYKVFEKESEDDDEGEDEEEHLIDEIC